MWCVLYKESSCSISRLEFFEYKDGGSMEKNDRNLRKQQDHKKVPEQFHCLAPFCSLPLHPVSSLADFLTFFSGDFKN